MNRKQTWATQVFLWICQPVCLLAQQTKTTDLSERAQQIEGMQVVTVDLSTTIQMSTLVGYSTSGNPPWPAGNCLTLSAKKDVPSNLPPGTWTVRNMTSENFQEFVKHNEIGHLKLAVLNRGQCFIVDPRIPRQWLLTGPCVTCTPLETRTQFRRRYSEFFRNDEIIKSLVGKKWILDEREDPSGLLERLLPGDYFEIHGTELFCATESKELLRRLTWEVRTTANDTIFSIFDVGADKNYTGAHFKLKHEDDRIVLVPTATIVKTPDSVRTEYVSKNSYATYHLVPKLSAKKRM